MAARKKPAPRRAVGYAQSAPQPVRAMTNTQVAASELSTVFGQIGGIDGALDYTAELIDVLERKLAPILAPPPGDSTGNTEPLPLTALGAALVSTRGLAVRNNHRLNDLLERIVL